MSELDPLILELEDAAARLRSGELDAAAAASLVERLATVASQLGAALDHQSSTPPSGGAQETLL